MRFLTIIGDIHNYNQQLLKTLEETNSDYYIQLGDIGQLSNNWPKNFRFITGNHDNPNDCLKHKQCLKRYGFIENINVFYVSGADSYNKLQLIDNKETWENQELSEEEQKKCLDLYTLTKPRIIISHDCPASLYPELFNFRYPFSRTAWFLEILNKIHKPRWWIFGHHHRSINKVIDKTCYICLNIAETFTIPV